MTANPEENRKGSCPTKVQLHFWLIVPKLRICVAIFFAAFLFCCSTTDALDDVAPWASFLCPSLVDLRPRWPFLDSQLKVNMSHYAVFFHRCSTLHGPAPFVIPIRFTPRRSCSSVVLLEFHLRIAPALHALSSRERGVGLPSRSFLRHSRMALYHCFLRLFRRPRSPCRLAPSSCLKFLPSQKVVAKPVSTAPMCWQSTTLQGKIGLSLVHQIHSTSSTRRHCSRAYGRSDRHVRRREQ